VAAFLYSHCHQANILIEEFLNAKICDLGLVRLIQRNGSSTGLTTSSHTGTVRYLAYELVECGELPTTSSDVHALGCIGLEVSSSWTLIGGIDFINSFYSHNCPMHKYQVIGEMPTSRSAERLLAVRLLRYDRMDSTPTCWDCGAYWNHISKFKSIDAQGSTISFIILSGMVAENTSKSQMHIITAPHVSIPVYSTVLCI
jgi:hypothetical protein